MEPSQLANNVARCEVRAPEVLEQQYIREGRDLDRAADALLLADAGSKARPAAAPGGPARAIAGGVISHEGAGDLAVVFIIFYCYS